jgi:hypothetical protein
MPKGRPIPPVKVTDEQRKMLEQGTRRPTTAQAFAMRPGQRATGARLHSPWHHGTLRPSQRARSHSSHRTLSRGDERNRQALRLDKNC